MKTHLKKEITGTFYLVNQIVSEEFNDCDLGKSIIYISGEIAESNVISIYQNNPKNSLTTNNTLQDVYTGYIKLNGKKYYIEQTGDKVTIIPEPQPQQPAQRSKPVIPPRPTDESISAAAAEATKSISAAAQPIRPKRPSPEAMAAAAAARKAAAAAQPIRPKRPSPEAMAAAAAERKAAAAARKAAAAI